MGFKNPKSIESTRTPNPLSLSRSQAGAQVEPYVGGDSDEALAASVMTDDEEITMQI